MQVFLNLTKNAERAMGAERVRKLIIKASSAKHGAQRQDSRHRGVASPIRNAFSAPSNRERRLLG